jgi:hypothetical protein
MTLFELFKLNSNILVVARNLIVLTPNNIQNSSKQSTTLLGRNIEFNGANFTELNETVSELEIIWSCPGYVNLPWGRCCNWLKKKLIF